MLEFNPKTIKIGNIEWMAENLNLTDDGLGKDHWKNPKNGEVYYSWEASMRIANKVEGFHLPSVGEWNPLAEDCGCVYEDQKESNSDLQNYNNTDELKKKLVIKLVGFYETGNKDFFSVRALAGFWTSTEKNNKDAYMRHFGNWDYMRSRYFYKKHGLSVRLVKDSM